MITPRVIVSSWLAVAAGVLLLAVVMWDVVTTVFGPSMGSDPLTRGWERLLAPLARRLRTHRPALVWVGPMFAAVTTPSWLGLLWFAWALEFQPAGSVVTPDGRDADDWVQAYFAGYSLVTLGNGEFQPGSALWQAMSVVAAASGLILITLGLGYLVALVAAAIQRHATAARIHGWGRLRSTWSWRRGTGGT
ncbi:hypothetical protein [Pseudonocardia nigra]|uniref:hypothetical protein n=1 Tax=Pseudonocardia nigra TaxID=1921578 RepID=UPI001C5E3710|nr:hypothetical protein [Pseudonocardia nigra]